MNLQSHAKKYLLHKRSLFALIIIIILCKINYLTKNKKRFIIFRRTTKERHGGKTKEREKKSSKCFSYSFHRVHHKMQKQKQTNKALKQYNETRKYSSSHQQEQTKSPLSMRGTACKSLNSSIASRTSRRPKNQKR